MINSISNNLIRFRGDDTISSKTNLPKSVAEYQQHKAKKDEYQKNKISFTKALAILFGGSAAALYIGGMVFRFKYRTNIKDITKKLSQTLRRELTESETKQIVEKYKEIFKINDGERFIQTAFEQIKKDYGYEKADIPLDIEYLGKFNLFANPFKTRVMGGFDNVENKIKASVFCEKGKNISRAEKKFVFDTLYHELKHMEQAHLCYLKNKDKYFDAIANYPDNNGKVLDAIEQADLIHFLEKNYKRAYENVPQKDTIKFDDVIDKYIENTANYKNPEFANVKEYMNQTIEKEAFEAQDAGSAFHLLNKKVIYLPSKPPIYILALGSLLCNAKDNHDKAVKTMPAD